jgi:hypothetical protein
MDIEKSKQYIQMNARPLDYLRWNYLFEGGSRTAVLDALAAYQNDDGGFGHALEPDCWNPESSPIQTWVATEIIREVQLDDRNHPMIRKIIGYLSSGRDFDGHTWANTLPSNNDYPHAPWWTHHEHAEISYNPTACLAGFIVRFAERGSSSYALGCRLVIESYKYFKNNFPMDSMHTVACYVRMYQYLVQAQTEDLIDMDEFRLLLHRQVTEVITDDTSRWASEYVCKPSLFIETRGDEFYAENKDIADYESGFLDRTQEPDGTWAITWEWDKFPEAWPIAKNWWKCDRIIKTLKYLSGIK